MNGKLRIRVWNEGVHEAINEPSHIGEIYPDGIHGAIAAGLRSYHPEAEITTAVLATDDEHGLDEEVLAETDVLLWWGHMAHHEVSDAVVERVHRHVLGGMGLIVLHSGHFAKVFTRLLGTGPARPAPLGSRGHQPGPGLVQRTVGVFVQVCGLRRPLGRLIWTKTPMPRRVSP